jgi:hypothetical protein
MTAQKKTSTGIPLTKNSGYLCQNQKQAKEASMNKNEKTTAAATTGAVIGLATFGPPGAAVGAGIGAATERVVSHFSSDSDRSDRSDN